MTPIYAFGQPVAGDDAVGLAVLAELEGRKLQDVSLVTARDPSILIAEFAKVPWIIVVDAVLASEDRVGEVLVLSLPDLDAAPLGSLSSHGLSVAQALALGQSLHPEASPRVTLVAVGIERPRRLQEGLSPRVQRAVIEAADKVESLLTHPAKG